MASESDPGGGVGGTRYDRVLLLLAPTRNRRLLAEWLRADPDYDPVTTTPGDRIETEFDLVVTDLGSLPSATREIRAHKRAERPGFRPCLVLVPDVDTGGSGDGFAALDDIEKENGGRVADDVIATPVRKRELKRRMEMLLRTRRLSGKLAARTEQYRELVQVLPDGVVVVRDGTVVWANEAATAVFDATDVGTLVGSGNETPTAPDTLAGDGTDGETASPSPSPSGSSDDDGPSLVGRRFIELVAPEDRERVTTALAAIRAGETGEVGRFFEAGLETADGQAVDAEVAGVRVRYGGAPATQLVVHDLTERKRRERRLALYRRAMDEAAIGISITGPTEADTPVVYANDHLARLTGRSREELLGRNLRQLQVDETDSETVDRLSEAIREERPVAVEIRNERAGDGYWWNALQITPVRDDDGEVTHYLGFQRDVTERKRREHELERDRRVLRAAGDPILTVDRGGEITYANDAVADLTGYPVDRLEGADVGSVLDERNRATARRAIEELRANDPDGDRTVEVTVETASGRVRFCEANLALLPPDENGDGGGAVAVLTDVTERRYRNQRLTVLDRVLRHNLRNGMGVVLGHAHRLKKGDDPTRHVDPIIEAAEELVGLAEDVRRFRDALSAEGSPTVTDLTETVETVVGKCRRKFPTADIEVDVPDRVLARVPPRFDLAVGELVDNAVEHNDRETPHVLVTLEPENGTVELVVEDDGPGIPEEERVVGEVGESALEHSSGIELWLVRWLVQRVGGELAFEDNDPRGTIARLRVPAENGN
jgi:PAS domain S-box-containing protein